MGLEVALKGFFVLGRDEDYLLDAGAYGLLHRVLNEGLVEEGQQLLGHSLGNGEESGAQTGGGNYGFSYGREGYHGRNSNTAPRCGQRNGENRQGPAHVGVHSYTPFPGISRPYTDILLLLECFLCCYPLPMNKLPSITAPSQFKQARKIWYTLSIVASKVPQDAKKTSNQPKTTQFTPEIPLKSQYSFLKSSHPTRLELVKRVPRKSARFQYGFSIVCLD